MITSCLSSHALTIEVLLTTICSVSYCRVYLALSSSSLVPKNYEYHTKQFRTFRIFQIRSQCSGHVTRSPNQITTRHEAHYFWYISCLHTFNLLCTDSRQTTSTHKSQNKASKEQRCKQQVIALSFYVGGHLITNQCH